MNPNGLLSGVGRVMGRYESRQWRSVMAVATTTSPELRPSIAVRNKRDDLDHQSCGLPLSQLVSSPSFLSSSSPPMSTQLPRLRHACNPVLRVAVTTAHLPRARSCVCDMRVPLFSELPITAANLYPNSKAYEASLSFESPPRDERCIQVFEYTPSQLAYL